MVGGGVTVWVGVSVGRRVSVEVAVEFGSGVFVCCCVGKGGIVWVGIAIAVSRMEYSAVVWSSSMENPCCVCCGEHPQAAVSETRKTKANTHLISFMYLIIKNT